MKQAGAGEREARHDRRSRRTRQMLGRALVELMAEKRYDSITVQEIIDRADVGRSTFYAHFRDKEDLFVGEFESLLAELNHEVEHQTPGGGSLVPSLGLFRHVQSHRYLYRALVRGRGLDVIEKAARDYFTRSLEERLEALRTNRGEGHIPGPVLANYLVGSLLSLLNWWLDNDTTHSPEQMDSFYRRLVTPGVMAAL
jgi:AcrR family transcriptional regulator